MHWLAPLMLVGCFSCATPEEPEPWRLVWSDEFQGDAGQPPNPENWTHDVGGDGWGNNQLEFNTDRTDNVALDGNGFLRIEARRESFEGNEYTSARIKSQGLQTFQYGRIAARIKVPNGAGIWPAFWLLGADFPDVGWPTCGEIDVMEIRGSQTSNLIGTVHGPGYNGGSGLGTNVALDFDLSDDFHVYAIEWDPEHISWSIDDQYFHRIHPGNLPEGTAWVFDHEFFLLLNLAIGGNFVEPVGEDTEFPAVMGVDWVRVYERTTPLTDPLAPVE